MIKTLLLALVAAVVLVLLVAVSAALVERLSDASALLVSKGIGWTSDRLARHRRPAATAHVYVHLETVLERFSFNGYPSPSVERRAEELLPR